jgi:hypothetical protein
VAAVRRPDARARPPTSLTQGRNLVRFLNQVAESRPLDPNLIRCQPNQELLSKCAFEAAAEDDGACELCEGEVELGSALPAGRDAPVCVEPGVGAFDRPALGCLRVACASAAARSLLDYAWIDAALAQRGADVFGVVAAVGEQLVGSFTAAATQRRDRIDDRDRVSAVVVVCRAQDDSERGAVAVAG